MIQEVNQHIKGIVYHCFYPGYLLQPPICSLVFLRMAAKTYLSSSLLRHCCPRSPGTHLLNSHNSPGSQASYYPHFLK